MHFATLQNGSKQLSLLAVAKCTTDFSLCSRTVLMTCSCSSSATKAALVVKALKVAHSRGGCVWLCGVGGCHNKQ